MLVWLEEPERHTPRRSSPGSAPGSQGGLIGSRKGQGVPAGGRTHLFDAPPGVCDNPSKLARPVGSAELSRRPVTVWTARSHSVARTQWASLPRVEHPQ